jgi:hypothetical protein
LFFWLVAARAPVRPECRAAFEQELASVLTLKSSGLGAPGRNFAFLKHLSRTFFREGENFSPRELASETRFGKPANEKISKSLDFP